LTVWKGCPTTSRTVIIIPAPSMTRACMSRLHRLCFSLSLFEGLAVDDEAPDIYFILSIPNFGARVAAY
jgi:hypothetical protein